MIKIYSSLTLATFIFTNFFSINIARASEQEAKKLFIVTAYYSPLPNQKVYLRGSYEADIKLNGAGVAGASGKKVFPGMLAAPKSYSFGTKLFLEGFGTGEVADRGGAIVTLENGETKVDRIDIWMGHGEEGLKRALSWGKRKVYGYIVENNSEIAIDLAKFPAYNSSVKNLGKSEDKSGFLSENIWLNSPVSKIKELQQILKDIGLYNGEIDGIYSQKIKDIITEYQIREKLIDSKADIAAGYTGAKTRASLRANYASLKKANNEKIELVKAEKKRQEKLALAKKEKEEKLNKEINKTLENHIASIGTPEPGEISQEVRNLQKTMKTLGYFDDKDTAIFGEKTKAAIIKYQIDKGIISDESSKNAGKITEKTLAKIKSDLKVKIKSQLVESGKLVSLVN